MRKYLLPVVVLLSLLASCRPQQPVSSRADYSQWLDPENAKVVTQQTEKEILFWKNRLARDTGNYVDMLELAAQYGSLFRLKGDIRALHLADSLLLRSSQKLNHTDPDILFALAQNSISMHRFRDADRFTRMAEMANGNPYTVRLLQFDSEMELGNYKAAWKSLESLQDKSTFDYLLRRAKWEDHRGNGEGAIALMESAVEQVKNKKKGSYLWALSNLADMYTHAGRIRPAYQAYLTVLQADPLNYHCLKGIARIAWVQDGNRAAAKDILRYILSQTEIPELRLQLAEISRLEGDTLMTKKYEQEFVKLVAAESYGNMYNKYLVTFYAGEGGQPAKALQLAEGELQNRFTPETCDWMAWAAYRNGDLEKAFAFSKGYVYKKTFEPLSQLHCGIIFARMGEKEKAKELFRDCLQAGFELGPEGAAEVKRQLASL